VKAAFIQVAVAAFMAADSSHVSPGSAPPLDPPATLHWHWQDPRSSWTLALVPIRSIPFRGSGLAPLNRALGALRVIGLSWLSCTAKISLEFLKDGPWERNALTLSLAEFQILRFIGAHQLAGIQAGVRIGYESQKPPAARAKWHKSLIIQINNDLPSISHSLSP